MGRRTALVLILLCVAALALWSWPRRKAVSVADNSAGQAAQSSAQNPAQAARTTAALNRETRRLINLQTDLNALTQENQTAEAIGARHQEVARRLQTLQDQINTEVRGTAQNDRLENTYRQNNRVDRNSALIGLEAEIQNLDAQIMNVQAQAQAQAQAQPARNIASSPFTVPAPAPEPSVDPSAPPPVSADQIIMELQTRKAQLQSQINIEKLNSQNADIQISQEAQAARDESQALKADLQRQLYDVQKEEAYWRSQAANSGDAQLRRQRIEYLESQITAQKNKISEMQNTAVQR